MFYVYPPNHYEGGIHFYTGNMFRSSGVTVEKILAKKSRNK